MKGRIHSFQSLGAVDGPGLRYVVFLQGCTLRCAYCHNPDTWNISAGEEYEADEIVRKILRYKTYFGRDGGVTVSGGEPLLQWGFVAELFQKLHAEGIRTALDTAGIGDLEGARMVLRHTDLVLCDLKFSRAEDYLRWCRGNMAQVAAFLELTGQMCISLWIRHVVVPGLNDREEDILRIASIAGQYRNLQKLELLPFRKICETKYRALGIEFSLHDYAECPESEIQRLYRLLESSAGKRP
jgi:pyruvate formate lyase activating enzyme